jgi:hypothetical protein
VDIDRDAGQSLGVSGSALLAQDARHQGDQLGGGVRIPTARDEYGTEERSCLDLGLGQPALTQETRGEPDPKRVVLQSRRQTPVRPESGDRAAPEGFRRAESAPQLMHLSLRAVDHGVVICDPVRPGISPSVDFTSEGDQLAENFLGGPQVSGCGVEAGQGAIE